MALNKAPSSSIFNKRSAIPSAAGYLQALSQADSRARAAAPRSTTSTPALSLSSSVTDSSEDTVLNDNFDNMDGLALPTRPPTSEQVFSTVHTEFGHCADERFRYTSKHSPSDDIPAHVEHDPPYYILLSTYISYLILIVLGHIRDFVGKRFNASAYYHLVPKDVSCVPPSNTRNMSQSPPFRVMLPSTLTLTRSIPAGSRLASTSASLSQSQVLLAAPSSSSIVSLLITISLKSSPETALVPSISLHTTTSALLKPEVGVLML